MSKNQHTTDYKHSQVATQRPDVGVQDQFAAKGTGVDKHEIRHVAASLYRHEPRSAKEVKGKTIAGAKARLRPRPTKNLQGS